jgi:hypothetical protein
VKKQQKQCTDDIYKHKTGVEEPQMVELTNNLLELGWNIDLNVMIEARLEI